MNRNRKTSRPSQVKAGRLKRRPAATSVGRRIQHAGFRFQDVAHLAGVTVRMVHYHLAGRSESPKVAAAIAKLLGECAA